LPARAFYKGFGNFNKDFEKPYSAEDCLDAGEHLPAVKGHFQRVSIIA
jgi:hypothetical protein